MPVSRTIAIAAVALVVAVSSSRAQAPASPPAAQGPAAQEYPGLETGKMWTFDAPPQIGRAHV